MRRILSSISMLVGLGACYRYVPLSASAPVVGTELRSYLSPEGAAAMAGTLGRNVSIFDGRLMGDESNVWRFAVTRTRADERIVSWTGEPVSIPRSAIARMEMRVLDRPKTIRAAILATLGGIGLGLAIRGIAGSASGDPNGGGGPPPP